MIRILVADGGTIDAGVVDGDNGLIGVGGSSVDCIKSDLTYTYCKTTSGTWSVSYKIGGLQPTKKRSLAALIGAPMVGVSKSPPEASLIDGTTAAKPLIV